MTDEELLHTPLKDLTSEQRLLALGAHDRYIEAVRKANKSFKPKPVKSVHHIISDELGGIVNPADGKHYDSKSKYYKAVKASGSHVVESGEMGQQQKRKQEGDYNVREELKQAIQQHLR